MTGDPVTGRLPGAGRRKNESRMNEQRARENRAYVRKLLSEREPEFAAALAAAERYISWSFRPGCDGDRDDSLSSDSGTVMCH